MKRRAFLRLPLLAGGTLALSRPAYACAERMRGTGDLGIVVERASGSILIVDTTERKSLGRVEGLGDLSHASAVFSQDERYAYVFGRDGGLTKVDILQQSIAARKVQAGNSIGGAISDDGRLIAVSNYDPGGVKVFDAHSLEEVANIPAVTADGKVSKTVGLVDAPGSLFVYCLYDAGEIWVADFSQGNAPRLAKHAGAGVLPYDGILVDGRHYMAGLFGEDGLTFLDLWAGTPRPQKVLRPAGSPREKLPVYKMPHLGGCGVASGKILLPAAGQHELIVLNAGSFQELARLPMAGQPVFAVVRPGGRYAWVNFALPNNDTIQVVDIASLRIVHEFKPGPAVLHMEFLPKGAEVWVSVRDADRVDVYNAATYAKLAELPAQKPSGIFFTPRAHKLGA
ncbi:MAG: cytochrome D1 domain-containing protein [Rhodomicrobium sp.]